LQRAEAACASIKKRFGAVVNAADAADTDATGRVLEDTYAALCCGAAGVMLIPKSVWAELPNLHVLADVNAVPPLGIEGIEATWDGQAEHNKVIFGALGIGGLKMKIHRASVARLFEQNDLVLDAEEIYATAKEIGR
jgi:hypothetical protein